MLTVRDTRRSRSKSPGGRERSRSRADDRSRNRSRDTRDKGYDRGHDRDDRRYEREYDHHRSNKRRESSEESRDRRTTKSSSKKYYESDSESDRGHHKSRGGRGSRSDSDDARERRPRQKYYEDDDDRGSRRYYELSSRREEKRVPDRHDRRRSSSSSSEHSDHGHRHKTGSKSKKSSSSKKHKSESSGSSDSSDGEKKKSKKHDKNKGVSPIPGYIQPATVVYAQPVAAPMPPNDYHNTRHMSYVQPPAPGQYPPGYLGHTEVPDHHRTHSISSPPGTNARMYMEGQQYQYSDPHDVRYRPTPKEEPQYIQRGEKVYVKTVGPNREAQYVEVKTDKHNKHEKEKRSNAYGPSSSVESITPRVGRLAVAGAAGAGGLLAVDSLSNHGHHSRHGKPPASPLLEAYHGTYQSISPMPSPMMLPGSYNNEDVSDIDSLDESDSEDGHGHHIKSVKPKSKPLVTTTGALAVRNRHNSDVSIAEGSPLGSKRVTFYDPEKDAKALEKALNHHRVDTEPVIKILPHLSSDEILLLRTEYKKHAKVGGAGINIAKQIKMKITGNLGKAAYATALGRWESEAHWANLWYQGGATRRELLIESLMGRSNQEIREIKRCFSDKRYNDDLERCMKAELKADKFRLAILLALEERRMSEGERLDLELVKRDVWDLHQALVGKEGGETAMIQIIVVRSDNHLREIMRVFEATYKRNFGRELLAKSRNLVGETLAHILNGALNRPMRDALLLRQAIAETAPGKDRVELLISRVVRIHWEPKHMERVKMEYFKRYKSDVRSDLEREVKGEVAGFLGAMMA